jgi:hypothetical protein
VRQPELFDPVHQPTESWPDRLTHYSGSSVAERTYLRLWQASNGKDSRILRNCIHPVEPTQRDAAVAASVITWLGTNVGSGFVDSCERQIKREDNIVHRLRLSYGAAFEGPASLVEQATVIARVVEHRVDAGTFGRLVDAIAHGLKENSGSLPLTIGPRPPVERGIILRPEEP